jgi:hypothetical protein
MQMSFLELHVHPWEKVRREILSWFVSGTFNKIFAYNTVISSWLDAGLCISLSAMKT